MKQQGFKILKIIRPLLFIPLGVASFIVVQEIRLNNHAQKIQKCTGAQGSCQGITKSLETLAKADRRLKNINFEKTHLQGVHLNGANFNGANFNGANLEKADFKGALLIGAHFNGSNFNSAHLNGARLNGAYLNGAQLKGADLEEAHLEGAKLYFANLNSANLKGAQLYFANLKSANLKSANLKSAKFQGANFQSANFEGANLQGANFEGANLQGANLQGANLQGANLEKTDFRSKEVIGVGIWIFRGLSRELLFHDGNAIYQNTPAFKAGIKFGDRISKINGQSVENFDIFTINKLLFNKVGTQVQLTILRDNQEIDYSLTSERFTMPVQGLTPEQLKQAKNWELAYYDPEFRSLLGLPSESSLEK